VTPGTNGVKITISRERMREHPAKFVALDLDRAEC
tara:strand:- start:146 stop:250 length:105 start_codon:yes stop_codon:yes gene_type:complete